MNLQYLCTNCLLGTIKDGICNCCHKTPWDRPPRPQNTLPDGYILGNRYYLGRVIGKGGFGITYLVLDCQTHQRVAVKELYPSKDVSRGRDGITVFPLGEQEPYFQKCRQRFQEEAQVLASFRQDPSVLNVYQLIEANNTVYYSMEYLSGFDLKSYLMQKGCMEWPMLSGYVQSILCTLHVIHQRGLIHRDISPDNLFLTSRTEVKLIDFGSVRCYNDERALTNILKKEFAPWEQYFTNGNQGPWTDIYSLSVTIYYALTGQLPPSAVDRAHGIEPTPLAALCPDLPDAVVLAVVKGMEVNLEDRYQNAMDMFRDMFPTEGRADMTTAPERQGCCVYCTQGRYHGKRFRMEPQSGLMFGRDLDCSVVYPPNSSGISRKQCFLWCNADGSLFIRDENSRYGTEVSGYRIQSKQWYRLDAGMVIRFAGEYFLVE